MTMLTRRCRTAGPSANLAPGPYTVTEAGLPIAGWDLTDLVCVGGGANTSTNTATGVSTIGLDAGENVTCTYTNTKQTKLKLVKTVTNNNGGTAVPNDWDLVATGSGGFTELTPDSATATSRIVNPGVSYALSETNGPSGYAQGTFSCVTNGGAPVSGDSITLSVGGSATCTITNNDIAPKWAPAQDRSERQRRQQDGGGLYTHGQRRRFGPPVGHQPGRLEWHLSPSRHLGVVGNQRVRLLGQCMGSVWVARRAARTSLSVSAGEATCTITNNDQPGTIVIRKSAEPAPDGHELRQRPHAPAYDSFTLTGQTQQKQQ